MYTRRVLAGLGGIVVLILLAAVVVVLRGPAGYRVTAYFTEAIGVHAGSDVKILGVSAGKIDSVRPEGTQVRVEMTVDHGIDLPADVRAVVVAPSVVADRFVQLAPAYTNGPKLAPHSSLGVEKTATPVELDQLYGSLKQLTGELGPGGVNNTGALSDLINAGAANLKGNGLTLRSTIENLGKATKTLTGSQANLFGTIDNLQKFTTMIRDNDSQVRQAEEQLASVDKFLADDREDIGAAMQQLAVALAKVQKFISDNRSLVASNVNKLATITQILVDQRKSLAEALDTLPLDVDNVLNAYDPTNHLLLGRADPNELSMPLASKTSGGGQ